MVCLKASAKLLCLAAALSYIRFLCAILCKQVLRAESSLSEAAQKNPVHGAVLALRYVFSSLELGVHDSTQTAAVTVPLIMENLEQWKVVIQDMLDLIYRAIRVALQVVAYQAPEGWDDVEEHSAMDEFDASEQVPFMFRTTADDGQYCQG